MAAVKLLKPEIAYKDVTERRTDFVHTKLLWRVVTYRLADISFNRLTLFSGERLNRVLALRGTVAN